MINDFSKILARNLKEYTEEVGKAIKKEVDNTSRKMVQDLKSTSPKETGGYAKQWEQKKLKEGTGYEKIVYNKKYYRLTHLLEKGHATRNGGRVAASPHILPVEEKYVQELEKNVEKIIKNGG